MSYIKQIELVLAAVSRNEEIPYILQAPRNLRPVDTSLHKILHYKLLPAGSSCSKSNPYTFAWVLALVTLSVLYRLAWQLRRYNTHLIYKVRRVTPTEQI